MSVEREMTLNEYVGRLPEIHAARKELAELETEIATLQERITREEETSRLLRAVNIKYEQRIAAQAAEIAELNERIGVLENAVRWACGETDFRLRREKEGHYWWRTELRERAKVPYIPPAQEPQGGQGNE
jgi:chromosome segregation ATPase